MQMHPFDHSDGLVKRCWKCIEKEDAGLVVALALVYLLMWTLSDHMGATVLAQAAHERINGPQSSPTLALASPSSASGH